jgi:hypothetical protein
MRKIFLIAILTICIVKLYAQDLIVTSEGDSLNCKITSIKNENVYFTFKHKEETRSTLLPVSQIKTYQYNYYKIAVVSVDKIVSNETFPHWRLAIDGGYSYQTANVGNNVPSGFSSYVEGLKSGYHFAGDVTYYFTEFLGVGFKYLLFKTSNQMDNISVTLSNGVTKYGNMSDDISITFIGPTFCTRLLNSNKKNALYLDLGVGYLGYQDNAIVVDKYIQTGNTVGLVWDLGYDIGLSKNMAIGFNLALITGTLSEYDLNDGVSTKTINLTSGNYIGLGRIDLSIGIRFNSGK